MILLFLTQIILFSGLLERLSSGGSTRSKRASGRGKNTNNLLSSKEKLGAYKVKFSESTVARVRISIWHRNGDFLTQENYGDIFSEPLRM
jgi:hypothetical protein